MRVIFFLLLLIAGWAIIFYPMFVSQGGLPLTGSFSANPSSQPLPGAWEGSDRLQVQGASQAEMEQAVQQGSACGSTYTIQNGDTLGDVAKTCGISLSDLLAANTQIANPNHVVAGQVVSVPNPLAGRGGGDPLAQIEPQVQSGRLAPGSTLEITAQGLPPNTNVRIGLGLESSGYRRLTTAQTDAQGDLVISVTIPFDAAPGEDAFIQLTTEGVPTIQRMSETFVVGW